MMKCSVYEHGCRLSEVSRRFEGATISELRHSYYLGIPDKMATKYVRRDRTSTPHQRCIVTEQPPSLTTREAAIEGMAETNEIVCDLMNAITLDVMRRTKCMDRQHQHPSPEATTQRAMTVCRWMSGEMVERPIMEGNESKQCRQGGVD